MGDERTELLAALDTQIEAIGAALVQLREAEAAHRTYRDQYASGATVPAASTNLDVSGLRQGLLDSLRELERATHEGRRATFAVGLSEGMTIASLGRLYGFSRQLAARYAGEVRATT